MSNFCRITTTASRDIESIMDYLAERVNIAKAEYFLEKINAKFTLLTKFPKIGRKRGELYPNLRSIALDDYLIFYRLVSGGVEIMRVLGGYRDLEGLFTENNED